MSRIRRRSAFRRRRPPRHLRRPVIGITCEVHKLKPYFSEFELVCDYRYVRAILRAGGTPVILPILPFGQDIARLLDGVDALVVVGGADIHPAFYGEASTRKVEAMYRGRTYFEMGLYRAARRRGLPVLCICYGLQLLNVIHGGTLYQDIALQVKGARNHRSKRRPMHKVRAVPGSLLGRVLRRTSFPVHSEHHQAVKKVGRSLRVSAWADDGVPEALEGPPDVLAVQWHPERQEKDEVQNRLFRYFVRLARRSRTS